MHERGLHTDPRVPTIFAVGALVLSAVASAAGLFVADLYRDTEAWVREAQATDVVTLLLAVPILALALWVVRRGDVRWKLVAAGTIWYLAYSYAIFAFSVAPNPLSLLYIAILGLSSWSLVLGSGTAAPTPLTGVSPRLPSRATAVFLIAVPGLFGLLWLGEIASAVSAAGPSEKMLELGLPTNPVWALDLAFALPVVAYGGIRLIRSDPRALATALPSLVFLALIGLAVFAVFVFDIAAGAALEPVPMVIVGTITVIAVALSVTALRSASSA
jgi:hypothetical protein